MKTLTEAADELLKPVEDLVFDHSTGKFYRKETNSKDWTGLRILESVKEHISKQGYSLAKERGKASPADTVISHLQSKDGGAVDYAGELAGHDAGIYSTREARYLVTNGATLPTPTKTDWSLIKQFLETLFINDVQLHRFYGWMKIAIEARNKGAIIPGQACVFAGPPGCGKSLLQQRIITALLGGRTCKPIQYIRGTTTFNKDLTRAEHWVLEDEHASTRLAHRRAFGTAVKDITVNQMHRLHGKGRDAQVSLPLFIRLTVSLNDEPENLMVLPPLDDSIVDKMMIFHVGGEFAFDIREPEKRMEFEAKIDAAIPGFAWFLINEWVIADELKDTRFGIKAYISEEIMQVFEDNAEYNTLLELIDSHYYPSTQSDRVVVTSAQLQNTLESADCIMCHTARQLLGGAANVGGLLRKIADKYPDRVKCLTTGHSSPKKWGLYPPKR